MRPKQNLKACQNMINKAQGKEKRNKRERNREGEMV